MKEVDVPVDTPGVTLMCACRRPAALFTANTTANPSREFYKCATPTKQAVRCSCFKNTQV